MGKMKPHKGSHGEILDERDRSRPSSDLILDRTCRLNTLGSAGHCRPGTFYAFTVAVEMYNSNAWLPDFTSKETAVFGVILFHLCISQEENINS